MPIKLISIFEDPSTIECYYCFGHAGTQHDDCDDDFFGDKITCQMHDRQLPNYGDVCYVGHTGCILIISGCLI